MGRKILGICGGDRRQLYLAEAAEREGFRVLLAGFDEAHAGGRLPVSPLMLGRHADAVLLPFPVTRDGETLHAPLFSGTLPLAGEMATLFRERPVYAGGADALRAASPQWEEAPLFDYAGDEALLLGNARLTAEGAVAAAIEAWPGALWEARCLVCGFGRIGRALCGLLHALGAGVCCAARREETRQAVREAGFEAAPYDALPGTFDLVFNTVPAPVLTMAAQRSLRPEARYFELASAPGGAEKALRAALGENCLALPGLPGKVAPKAAGELIWKTVRGMLPQR